MISNVQRDLLIDLLTRTNLLRFLHDDGHKSLHMRAIDYGLVSWPDDPITQLNVLRLLETLNSREEK